MTVIAECGFPALCQFHAQRLSLPQSRRQGVSLARLARQSAQLSAGRAVSGAGQAKDMTGTVRKPLHVYEMGEGISCEM